MSGDRWDDLRAALADERMTPGPWRLEHRACDMGDGDDESSGLGWDWAEEYDEAFEGGRWRSLGPEEPMLRGYVSRWADARYINATSPERVEALLAERDTLAAALRQACADSFSDGEGAAAHYLEDARAALAGEKP